MLAPCLLPSRPRPFQVLNFASVETCSQGFGIRLEIKPRLRERLCEIVGSLRCSIFLRLTQEEKKKKKKKKKKKDKDLGAVPVIDLSDYEALEQSSVASVVLLLLLFSFLGVRD
jgi:hypothetical protein